MPLNGRSCQNTKSKPASRRDAEAQRRANQNFVALACEKTFQTYGNKRRLVLTGEAGDFVISLRLCVSAREYCFCGVGNYLSHGPEGWVLVAEKHKAIRNRIKEQILLKVPFAHFRVDRD